MNFVRTKSFKYIKNLIIGVGAAVVLFGALAKIESWPNASFYLTVGLLTESFIFLFLGIIGPEKDYYWEKLYPGLDDYNSNITPLTAGAISTQPEVQALNGEVVEQQLGGMLSELQVMSKSLSSLKALQEADFSSTGEQVRAMSNYYSKLNEAMAEMADSLEDTREYKEQLSVLNTNVSSLNQTYGVLNNAYGDINHIMTEMSNSAEDARRFRLELEDLNTNINALNKKYEGLNNVYGKVTDASAAMSNSVEDARQFGKQLEDLNSNITSLNKKYESLNTVYGNVISAMSISR